MHSVELSSSELATLSHEGQLLLHLLHLVQVESSLLSLKKENFLRIAKYDHKGQKYLHHHDFEKIDDMIRSHRIIYAIYISSNSFQRWEKATNGSAYLNTRSVYTKEAKIRNAKIMCFAYLKYLSTTLGNS